MREVVFTNAQNQEIVTHETTERADLPGVSVKSMYRDDQQNTYILKDVKQRTLATIFGKEYAKKLFEDYASLCSENPEEVEIITKAMIDTLVPDIFDQPVVELTHEYLEQLLNTQVKYLLSQLTVLGDATQIKHILARVRAQIPQLRLHVAQTLCNFMHPEILGPHLVKALWGEKAVAPETFYPKDYDPFNPQIISRFLKPSEDESGELQRFIEFLQPKITAYAQEKFNGLKGNVQREFISKHSRKKPNHYFDLEPFQIRSPHFWRKMEKAGVSKPKLEDLKLKAYQKKIMGKLYAMALITGHVDILNNIDGTNSGSMGGLPVCVDWGNSFNIGFGGLSKDESFLNWDQAKDVTETILENDAQTLQEMWSFQNPNRSPNRSPVRKLTSDKYPLLTETFCFPFVEQVFPFIPRLLVPDIFDLDDPDIFQGFVEFIQQAHQNIDKVDEGFQHAWPNLPEIQNMLNKAWFSPNGEGPRIIKARIGQLMKVVMAIPKDCKYPQAVFQQALLEKIKNFMEYQRNPKQFKPG